MAVFVAAASLCGRRGVHAFRAAAASSTCVAHNSCLPPPGAIAARQMHASAYSAKRRCSSPLLSTRLREQSSGEGDFEPTWTYVPYQPAPKRKPRRTSSRRFSTGEWTVPAHIPIPEDRLQISFARASGAGGQNVNKVNTKVELRFHVDSAEWIPAEVRDRLKSNEGNRINGEGFLTVTSQEHRTQLKNRKDAVKKLEDMLRNSWARPKVRKMRKGLTKEAKKNRRENKKRVSLKKESRKRVDF
ncbi:hypothetical protein ACHAXT_013010 [Thalassiosira profunda]